MIKFVSDINVLFVLYIVIQKKYSVKNIFYEKKLHKKYLMI